MPCLYDSKSMLHACLWQPRHILVQQSDSGRVKRGHAGLVRAGTCMHAAEVAAIMLQGGTCLWQAHRVCQDLPQCSSSLQVVCMQALWHGHACLRSAESGAPCRACTPLMFDRLLPMQHCTQLSIICRQVSLGEGKEQPDGDVQLFATVPLGRHICLLVTQGLSLQDWDSETYAIVASFTFSCAL